MPASACRRGATAGSADTPPGCAACAARRVASARLRCAPRQQTPRFRRSSRRGAPVAQVRQRLGLRPRAVAGRRKRQRPVCQNQGRCHQLSARRSPRARIFWRNAARRRNHHVVMRARAQCRRVVRTRQCRKSPPLQAQRSSGPAQQRTPLLSAQPRPPAQARCRALRLRRSPCRRRRAPQLASRRTPPPPEPRATQRRRPARHRRRLRPSKRRERSSFEARPSRAACVALHLNRLMSPALLPYDAAHDHAAPEAVLRRAMGACVSSEGSVKGGARLTPQPSPPRGATETLPAEPWESTIKRGFGAWHARGCAMRAHAPLRAGKGTRRRWRSRRSAPRCATPWKRRTERASRRRRCVALRSGRAGRRAAMRARGGGEPCVSLLSQP